VSQLVINDLVMNIKKMLYDDSLPPDNMSARSATEIVQRMKELSQNLGSAYGRLITEAMGPLVRRILYVMDERGLIDLPLKVDGLEVRITPTSPLAEAQNMEDLEKVLQFAQIAQSAGPIGQIAMNQDELVDYIAEKMGIPQRVLNNRQEREAIAMQMQQQMAAMQQQQPMPPELKGVTLDQASWYPGEDPSHGFAREGQNSIVREIIKRIERGRNK